MMVVKLAVVCFFKNLKVINIARSQLISSASTECTGPIDYTDPIKIFVSLKVHMMFLHSSNKPYMSHIGTLFNPLIPPEVLNIAVHL